MEDLEEAISCRCEALSSILLATHIVLVASTNLQTLSLLATYERLGRMEDLEKGIRYCREALTLHPPGHPDCSNFLNNLANAVRTRYKQLGRMEDLEEAISCYREALIICPLG